MTPEDLVTLEGEGTETNTYSQSCLLSDNYQWVRCEDVGVPLYHYLLPGLQSSIDEPALTSPGHCER